MASINDWRRNIERTAEGGPARSVSAFNELRRTVLGCLLWEDNFYESGESVAERIKTLVPKCRPFDVAQLAIEAREAHHLRHVPLLLVREMARKSAFKNFENPHGLVAETLARIIQRADEIPEFLALYWSEGRCPIAKQVKKGLAAAFHKFDEYQLAKYDREKSISLQDVAFLVHAKPHADEREHATVMGKIPLSKGRYHRGLVARHPESLLSKLIAGQLKTPDTWEVELSKSTNKGASWRRLLLENRLGYLALLRNLRNMTEAGVDTNLISQAITARRGASRVLPFRYIAAAAAAPQFERELDFALALSLDEMPRLPGKTCILVDVSGSMFHKLSAKSDLERFDAAAGVAIVAANICEHPRIFTFSEHLCEVPPRKGMALRDALRASQPHSSTYLGAAIKKVQEIFDYDRIIVVTDEQSADHVGSPRTVRGYMINVASDRRGVGYGSWVHIDGFSESVIKYIQAVERIIV